MLVVRTWDVQISATDVVHSLIVDQEGAICVLDGAVGGEDGVVGLDNGRRDLGGRVDGKFQFALLAVVDRKSLEEESAKSRASATSE